MKDIPVADVRNFVLVGHTGSGKTSLVDSLLYKLGVNDRLGNPGDGTSLADWTDEEKNRKISIWAKAFDAVWRPKGGKALRLVMLDTPGYADFFGQVVAATRVADAALIAVDATAGVQVGTVRAWKRCEALGLPRAIAITGLDKENADFDRHGGGLAGPVGRALRGGDVPGRRQEERGGCAVGPGRRGGSGARAPDRRGGGIQRRADRKGARRRDLDGR